MLDAWGVPRFGRAAFFSSARWKSRPPPTTSGRVEVERHLRSSPRGTPRARLAGVICAWALLLAGVGMPRAAAQEAPLVLRPEPSLRPLAERVARDFARRTGRRVEVGEPPPPLAEAVPRDHVALIEREARLWLGVGASEGRTIPGLVDLPPGSSHHTARTVSLALESLLEEAAMAPARPPEGAGTGGGGYHHYTYLEYAPERPERQLATPTIYLRLLAGYSPSRHQALLGPGAGFGVCVGAHCMVIEADLPLLHDTVQTDDGREIRYRAINTALRLQIRPYAEEHLSAGLTAGLLVRSGKAQLVGTDFRDVATSVGIRTSAELAWRFAGPFEWVFEVGLDLAFDRASYLRTDTPLEDTYTPWITTSLRMRPAL